MHHALSHALRAVALICLLAAPAHAHFVWLSIRGESDRHVEMHFSEGRFDDTMVMLNNSLKGVEVFTPDGALAMSARTSGFTAQVSQDLGLVGGHLVYGLFERGGPAALLTYDAKGARTLEDAGRKVGLVLEMLAAIDGKELVLTVLHDGKPLEGSQVVVTEDGTIGGAELETNAEGQVRLPMPRSTTFSARARLTSDESGEFEGKPYARAMRYTTLCIERLRPVDMRGSRDPEAWLRLEGARVRRASLPSDVHGVRGSVRARMGGKTHKIEFVHLGDSLEIFESETLEGADLERARETVYEALMRTYGLAMHPKHWDTARIGEGTSPLGQVLDLGTTGHCVIHEHEMREIRMREGDAEVVRAFLETERTDAGQVLSTVESRVRLVEEQIVESTSIVRTYNQVEEAHLPATVREVTVEAGTSRIFELTFGTLELIR